MNDIVHFGRKMYVNGASCTINVSAAAAARKLTPSPVSWDAIWIKAMAAAAADRHELRTCYLPYPWQRLYLHPYAVAGVPVERTWNGAPAVFGDKIVNPAALSLIDIETVCESLKQLPIESIGGFRFLIRLTRLPWVLRRLLWHLGTQWSGRLRSRYIGTYSLTKVARRVQALQVTAPVSFNVYWSTPAPNGDMPVQFFFDHRVADGMSALRVVLAIEKVMNEDIAAELRRAAAIAKI
jgi:hypothetical protein